MFLMLRLIVKIFLKQKILNKLLPKKANRRRRPQNSKDVITALIKVGAVYLPLKTAPSLFRLTENWTIPAKYMADLHILLSGAILSWAKKKIW